MTAVKPIPDGYPHVSASLSIDGADAAIKFYTDVLGATERLLAIRERLDDRHRRATILSALGSVHRQRGEHDLARTRLLHSMVAFRQRGDAYGQAVALRRLGRLARARSRWRYALRLLEQLESRVEVSEVRHLLAHGRSRHERARPSGARS